MPAARRHRAVRRPLGYDLGQWAATVALLGALLLGGLVLAGFMARWAWGLLEFGWRLHG